MSTTVEAPQPETLVAAEPPREDLSKYDSRRAIARAVDGIFVGAPFLIPVLGLGFALSVALVAICLLYFFVCEALWGQTLGKRLLGLRVLMRDGEPATAKAVGLRTSTRIFEDGPIGLAVFLASGKRRGRLGDMLGDTIVARPAPGLPRAGFSPLLIAVPAGIAVAAIAVVLALLRAFRAPGLPARRRQDVRAQHGRRRRDTGAGDRRDRRPHGRRPPQARRGRYARQRAQAAGGDPRARRLRHPRGGSGRARRTAEPGRHRRHPQRAAARGEALRAARPARLRRPLTAPPAEG